jgi:hypothetical protein
MALQLPNIYTLGQVQVNTQPLAQLQGQLLAKQQAKEEALDKYYNDLTGKITSAGMHSKDIPGFLKEKEELAKYWNSNKNEISKGGLAKQEFDARANKIFSHVEQSKGDVKFLYDMRDKDIEDEDMPKLAARGRSIYDPAYYKDPNTLTQYDYSDFTHFVPLPDTQKQDAFWSAVSRDYKPKVIEYEKDAKGNFISTPKGLGSFTNVYKFTERYADDQILGMADRAAEFVATDKSFRKLYNGILNDAAKATKEKKPLDPRFVELKDAYDKLYPGGIMDTPEEVAKASAIVRYKKFLNTGEKDVVDEKAREKYQSASIASRQKAGGGEIDLSQYDLLGQYAKNKGVKSKGFFGFGGNGKTYVNKKDIDPKDYELIASKEVEPFTDKYGEEYFEVDPNTGDWKAQNATISASSVARRLFDKTTLSEEKRGATRFTPGAAVPGKSVSSGKSYKVGGKTFTLDQMKKAASKFKMSLDDYLKSVNAQ